MAENKTAKKSGWKEESIWEELYPDSTTDLNVQEFNEKINALPLPNKFVETKIKAISRDLLAAFGPTKKIRDIIPSELRAALSRRPVDMQNSLGKQFATLLDFVKTGEYKKIGYSRNGATASHMDTELSFSVHPVSELKNLIVADVGGGRFAPIRAKIYRLTRDIEPEMWATIKVDKKTLASPNELRILTTNLAKFTNKMLPDWKIYWSLLDEVFYFMRRKDFEALQKGAPNGTSSKGSSNGNRSSKAARKGR